MLTVALYQPEIPPNTGNIMRLCANTGCELHLIEPFGFELDDKRLRRAGLDYAEWQGTITHRDWQSFIADRDLSRVFAATTRASQSYTDVRYLPGDCLLFGPETRGLPEEILAQLGQLNCIRLPMRDGSRSLNLSNSAAVAVYEAWRQLGFSGGA
jgi:tRNA (cytidine/uridine-2'-O-)-methyltransferase